ncbi:putative VAMP-associated protein [Lyophyllum shimeji]|uniref:VAMP-associated protein n=1 Tax=Lyophyllum shimeji TaxID=47721 RepID=A0A9P3UNY4_LYOSH|nr:putative VAMP-associated protein [Lyophyllum shimeji]
MSVSLSPGSSLGFKRPLTQLVKRSLTITNHNSQPVAFKVKTTAPKLYCVRPNSGRVEPGESVDVSVMLQALREEPPLNAKCKDKFLIQSTLITAEKETMSLQEIWTATDKGEEGQVHQQKLRVVYLPAEGQTLEEEEEPQPNPQPNPSSFLHPNDSQFETVRQKPIANGHPQPIPQFNEPQQPLSQEPARPPTPPADFSVAREDSREDSAHDVPMVQITSANEPPPASPARPAEPPLTHDSDLEYAPEQPAHKPAPEPAQPPEPRPIAAPGPTPAPGVSESPNAEILAKYQAALSEIDRLRGILVTMEEAPPMTEASPSEFRRRRPALSDDGSVADTDVATMVDDSHFHGHQQEGVPLQVVVIIALGVFITTYLFF